MTAQLVPIDKFDNFVEVKEYPTSAIIPKILDAVRRLDEREELGPFIQAVLADTNETPHGPVEIADILTHKVSVGGKTGTAAFVLKGRSFKTVRAKDVAHQIYKLERI